MLEQVQKRTSRPKVLFHKVDSVTAGLSDTGSQSIDVCIDLQSWCEHENLRRSDTGSQIGKQWLTISVLFFYTHDKYEKLTYFLDIRKLQTIKD